MDPLVLIPHYRDYVWGGRRLRPSVDGPTAEAWVIYAEDIIENGPLAGKTLAEAAETYGEELLGRKTVKMTGKRFPLLIKLLDCAAWLSLQVHPNDEQARQLEGEGYFGKMEAWYFIDAQPEAKIYAGFKNKIEKNQLEAALTDGSLVEHMASFSVRPDESMLIPPGLIHALGPGMFLYEVQQTSDITYRVWDWGRPRPLHIEQTMAVTDLEASGKMIAAPNFLDGEIRQLLSCSYFRLSIGYCHMKPVNLDTGGESFDAITLLNGKANLIGKGFSLQLSPYQSVVVPASCGKYQIQSLEGPAKFLRSRTI